MYMSLFHFPRVTIVHRFDCMNITVLHVGPGLCSSRAQWPLAPNVCSQVTRKSYFFLTNHMLGTLDFAGSEHWAPFNFPRSIALRTALPSPPTTPPPPPPGQRHHSINRLRENRSRATKGKLRGGGEGTRLGIERDYYSRRQ